MDDVMAQAMEAEDVARRTYHGDDAVIAAAKHYGFKGPIDPIARRIIHEEGFVNGPYKDSKGILTEGVGVADPSLRGKPWFTEVLPIYQQQAQTATKGYENLSVEQQGAITSMAYRGDWGKKTRGHLNKGNLKGAAKEYLNHNEYRKGKAKGATDAQRAISRRMLENARDLDPNVKA
jgi:GH24 family phage-related lysozyme (muramidase)